MADSSSKVPNRLPAQSHNSTRTWGVVFATTILIGMLYMGQASETVIIGERVHNKQERLMRLMQENAELEADLASLLAPDRLDARAKVLSLHIAKPDQVKYLPVEIVLTPTPSGRSGKVAGPAGSATFDVSTWWNDLTVRLGWSRSSELDH